MSKRAKTTPFVRAFIAGTKSLFAFSVGSCPGCATCGLGDEPTDEERELADEAHFRWSACQVCGSTFGGDRHPAHYIYEPNGARSLEHVDVCTDCLLFAANGDEPEEWRRHP